MNVKIKTKNRTKKVLFYLNKEIYENFREEVKKIFGFDSSAPHEIINKFMKNFNAQKYLEKGDLDD